MNTTAQSNPPARSNLTVLMEEVRRRESELTAYLPQGISAERFMQLARKAITDKPDLATCSTHSVLKALRDCATSGLPLDGHYSSLVIRRSKGGEGPTLAGWDASAHGMTWLAMESGFVRSVDSDVVREHDEFRYERGSAPLLHHVPLVTGARGPVIASYAVAVLKDGSKQIEVLLHEDLARIKAASSSGDRGPWNEQQWPDEMAKKSAIRRLLKRLPAGSIRLPDDSPVELPEAPQAITTRELLPEDQHALESNALAQLSDASNIAELDAAWTAAQLSFRQRGAEVPLAVEARWRDLRDTTA